MANKTVILIDNGHGKETPGKCSPDGSLKEYAWAREVACMVCDILQAEGYNAKLLVPEERDVPLAERAARANKFDKNKSVLISIHVNAAGSDGRWRNARGWRIFTTRGITEADTLAEFIWKAAKATFRAPLTVGSYSSQPLGHDWENDFYIIKKSYMPAVLVENFFQDNKEDVAYMLTAAGKAACAEVIVAGVKDYFRNGRK